MTNSDTFWTGIAVSHKNSILQVPCFTLTHVTSLNYSLYFILFETFLIKATGETSVSFLTKHICLPIDTGIWVSNTQVQLVITGIKKTHSNTFLLGKPPTKLWPPQPWYVKSCGSFLSPLLTDALPPNINQKPHIGDHHIVSFTDGEPLTFWHRSFSFNSNKSPTWCNNFSVYYSDVCLQLNMFRAFSRPSSGAQWLQWQPLVLPLYCGDSRAVFVVGPAGKRPKHVELQTDVRIINWKTVALGWWFIWIVRWCTDLKTLNFTFKF